jgi:hypothetical protein
MVARVGLQYIRFRTVFEIFGDFCVQVGFPALIYLTSLNPQATENRIHLLPVMLEPCRSNLTRDVLEPSIEIEQNLATIAFQGSHNVWIVEIF